MNPSIALLFVGLMRIIDNTHKADILRTVTGCSVFVVTYESQQKCAADLVLNNSSRLHLLEPSALNTRIMKSGFTINRFPQSLYQWLLLDEGLKFFNQDLNNHHTIIRTRTDLVTPPNFQYSSLLGTEGVLNARTDFFFYSTQNTFRRVFDNFFHLATVKYSHTKASMKERTEYVNRLLPNVVTCITSDGKIPALSHLGSDITASSEILPKKIGKPIHQLTPPLSLTTMVVIDFNHSKESKFLCGCQVPTDLNVPWRTMKKCAPPSGQFCSESALTYHVLIHGVSCQPIFGSPHPPPQPYELYQHILKQNETLNNNLYENKLINITFKTTQEEEKVETGSILPQNKVDENGEHNKQIVRGKKDRRKPLKKSSPINAVSSNNKEKKMTLLTTSQEWKNAWGEMSLIPTDFSLRADRHKQSTC